MSTEYCHEHGEVTPVYETDSDVARCPVCEYATSTTLEEAVRYHAQDNYTDYTYQVQVRIDSDTGGLTAFVFGQDSGEIGNAIHGGTDLEICRAVGRAVIEDARREEHGWEAGETLEDHA